MSQDLALKRNVTYMCAAPRISTRADAEITGPRAHILGFIKGFESLGWQVHPFIVGDRMPRRLATKKMESSLSGGGIRALALDLMRWGLGIINARLAWQELGGQIDWVYERFSPFVMLGKPFKRRGIPWVLETHAPLFYEGKTERQTTVLEGLARRLELQAYRECDALVCISEALKEIILQEANIPPEKVLVLPNAVDLDRFNPVSITPKRLFSGFTIGFVGRLYAWHGLDLLLEAVHELRREHLDISLVVVGDGLVRREWEAKARDLGIASQVNFVGQVPWHAVPQYIAGFDVGYIGNIKMRVGAMYHSPLKLYEYMAMAKPVVASAFDDAKRIVREYETGFLFEPGHKEDLKLALRRAYECRGQLPKMGQCARVAVETEHSWSKRVQDMITHLETIFSRS
ncbi:MAG: glycosyltransferase [Cyanothece sp. SIO1E1]|nr:glycosyltransferase [Cyanothece sp. SIO1E1]